MPRKVGASHATRGARYRPPSAHAGPPALLGAGGLALVDACADPPMGAPDWLAAAYARVLLMSSGPFLARSASGPLAERWAAAGVERLAPDADAEEARAHLWPAWRALAELDLGAGSPAPRVVLVGEVPGEWGPRRPFLSTSGIWAYRALRRAGYDELTIYATNARPTPRARRQVAALARLAEVLAPHAPTWVACGREAALALRQAKVEHVGADHPAYARRFRYREGEEGYARRLLEAGLPPGPWRGEASPDAPALPTHAVAAGDAPELPPPFGGLPRSFSRTSEARRGDGAATAKRAGVATAKAARARILYVAGHAESVRAAATAVGAAYEPLLAVARAEGWEREREEWQAENRRRVLEDLSKQEAGALGAARRASAAAAALAMQQLVQRLRSGELQATPADAERLTRAAHLLQEHADAEGSADLAEVYVDLRRAVADQLGVEGLLSLDERAAGGAEGEEQG